VVHQARRAGRHVVHAGIAHCRLVLPSVHCQRKESSGESSTKILPSLTLIVCRVPGIEKNLTILSESKGI
jgi:hypothetical protein